MTTLLETLKAQAFLRAEAHEANEAIDEARHQLADEGAQAPTSYEVVLPALAPERWLSERLLPKLVSYLDSRGARLPQGGGVFVSLFADDGLYFIDAGAFAMTVGATRGLSAEELTRRYREGGVGDPLALGSA
jgi:phage tail protein X